MEQTIIYKERGDTMNPTIILMCGIPQPASGKTTFIQKDMHRYNVSAVRISRDDIRKALVGEDVDESLYFSKEDEVFDNFVNLTNAAVKDGVQRIYIDATHISPASRKKILSRIINRQNLSLQVVSISCPTKVAQARNLNRTGFAQVPRTAIYNMARRFKKPEVDEFTTFGFKAVTVDYIN